MGVTDWKLITVAGNENFKKACQNEKDARFYWVQNWGWLSKEIIDVHLKMVEVKEKKLKRKTRLELKRDSEGSKDSDEKVILQSPCPRPNTTNHEYGWLTNYPDWKLERFGPFPLLPLKARTEFPEEEVKAMMALKKEERRQQLLAQLREMGK